VSRVNIPPQSEDAEMAVLGAAMIESIAADKALSILRVSDFYVENHRIIFDAFSELRKARRPVDIVTVSEHLRKAKHLNNVGGMAYLSEIIHKVGTAAHVDHYAGIVKEKSRLRQVIVHCTAAITSCYHEATDADLVKADLLGRLAKIDGTESFDIIDFRKDLPAALDELNQKPNLLLTGFERLDRAIIGLEPGDLVAVGARTSAGKTALKTKITLNVARRKRSVLYITTEMRGRQIVMRVLPMETGIPAWKFRKRELTGVDFARINEVAAENLSTLPIWVLGKPRISLQEIRTVVSMLKPDLTIVDYLQRMKLPKAENRAYQLEEAMIELKTIAQECNTVMMVSVQLDRGMDKNPNVPPVLADFKGSSAIEAEADWAFMLWEPPAAVRSKRIDWTPPPPGHRDIDLWVRKARHGEKDVPFQLLLNKDVVEFLERAMPELSTVRQEDLELQVGDGHGH
jgi:replicative DNA helicase